MFEAEKVVVLESSKYKKDKQNTSLVKVIYKTNLKKDFCFIENSYEQDKIKQISS